MNADERRSGWNFVSAFIGVYRRLVTCSLSLVILLLAAWAVVAPRRIVSTAPSITEMLYALGLGDRVVGVTTFCHYPPEVAKKPKIGTYLRPDVEMILALRPDVVIAERSMIRGPVSLPSLKLNVVEVDDSSIEGIYGSIREIGRLASVPERAEALCASIRSELERIRRATAPLPRRKVLFIVGRTPGKIEDLIAAGNSSYLNELLALAGGENLLRDAAVAYAKISVEEVLARNPDVIIDIGEMADTAGVSEEEKRAVVALWSRYPSLKAVRNRRAFAIASDIFVVPGPRVVDAARQCARMIHPEAFR
jgi:iron complex transport system substrate-binding protein